MNNLHNVCFVERMRNELQAEIDEGTDGFTMDVLVQAYETFMHGKPLDPNWEQTAYYLARPELLRQIQRRLELAELEGRS